MLVLSEHHSLQVEGEYPLYLRRETKNELLGHYKKKKSQRELSSKGSDRRMLGSRKR